jgi:PPK2 family polyphosphate:nucleotide phosphotransferase
MVNDKHLLAKPGNIIRLSDFDPKYTGGITDKKEAGKQLRKAVKELASLQDKFYAYDRYALLIIFQALDAAGKDSTIKNVMSGINPQGCQVFSFKQPSAEELDHDYMWRTNKSLPERGRIGIFNRSYYEEVLVTKVHPEFILNQKLPGIYTTENLPENFWENRYSEINNFEKQMFNNGTIILKFFLNVSKEEQKARFLARINNLEKNWKFTMSDVKERQHWDRYHEVYEKAIKKTSTEWAPWYIIPADNKWYTRLAVCNIIVSTMQSLNLRYPVLTKAQKEQLDKAHQMLLEEK